MMKKAKREYRFSKYILITMMVCIALNSDAQLTLVSDNFNDGNITSNPAWSGNTNQYAVTNSSPLEGAYSLTFNNTGNIRTIYTQFGNSTNLSAANYIFTMLYRDNGSADPTSLGAWESFTNASVNHWRFYLAANSTSPNSASGVMLEHSGSALKLVVRSGGSGWEAGSFTISRNTTYSIKVVAKPNGNWDFYVDAGTGEATTLRASQWPNLFTSGSQNLYMIFQSALTSGNAGRFKWDNTGLFYKSLTVTQLTSGIATGDLETGMTNKALFGFSASANGGTIKIKTVKIDNTNNNNSGNFTNVKLYNSVDGDYSTAGDNTELTGVSIAKNGDRFDITNIEQDIASGTSKNYFLVADITAGGASSIQLSMTCSGCGGSGSTVYTENSETVNNFSFSGNTYNFIRVCVWNNTTAVGNYTDDWQSSNAWENYVGPPTANDVVMFSKGGTPNPLNVPTLTMKRLVIKNNTTVNITTSSLSNGSRTLTMGGSTGDDLEIESGSSLNVTSTGNTLAVSVPNGTTANIAGAINFSGKNHTLTGGAAAAITFTSGGSFTGGTGLNGNAFGNTTAGSVVFASGATLEDQVGLDYFTSNNVISLQSGSNYKHSTTTTPSIAGKTFGNLILNTGASFNVGSNTFTIGGNITGAGTLIMSSGTLNISGNFSSTGTFTCGTGTINLNGTTQSLRSGTYANLIVAGSGTKTALGNLSVNTSITINNGTVLDLGSYTLAGSFNSITNNGTIKSINTSAVPSGKTWGGTFEYTAPGGGQTIVEGTYNNLLFSNTTGTNTLGGNIVVNGTLTNGAGILDLGTNTLTGDLTSITNNGTIKTSNTSSAPVPAGKTWTGTFEYARAAGGQTIVNGTYNDLVSSNTTGTNTLGGNIVVNGTLTNGTGTLDLSTYTLTGTVTTVTNNGTIKTSSISNNPLASNATWEGTIQYARTNGGQTIVPGTYNNLTLSNTSGSNTANGSITVNGTLTTTSGGTFNLGTNALAGTLSAVSNNGTIQTANTSDAPLPSGKTWGGTVTYNGAAAQKIATGTYNNLTLSNTSGADLNGNTTVESILTLSNGKLSIGANTFTLNGTIGLMSATNAFTGAAGASLNIGGSGTVGTLYFDQTSDGSTNVLKNLKINRTNLSGLISLGNTVRIKDTLTPTAGTLNTNGFLTLNSDATGTARILTINPSVFSLNGDVTAERYITDKTARKWIFITSPVAGTTIRNGWQDDIFITGAGSGGTICGTNGAQYNSNGFDATTTNSPTIYTYDQSTSAKWTAIPNTTSTNIEKGKGYRVLVRGNRNDANACADQLQSTTPPTPPAVTLAVKGTLTTGNVNVTISPKTTDTYGYTLIGNPYACEVDFNNFYEANSSVINNKYWTYDPASSTTNYLTYNNGIVAGSAPSGTIDDASGNRIASGQAFFVESISGGTATFTESMKTGDIQLGVFKSNNVSRIIRTSLKKQSGDFIDNMVIRFSDDPSVTVAENPEWDAVSFNSGNYIASLKGTKGYAIQSRPLGFYNDTVTVKVSGSATGNYILKFTEFENFSEAAEIILIDLFAGTQTNVRLQPTYDFTITSNAASQGARFKLVFRSGVSVMPLSFVNLQASQKNNGVALNWTVAFEQDVQEYQVLKSTNGTDFYAIGKINSKGNSILPVSYEFFDADAPGRKVFYRIAAKEKNGKETLSNIVLLNGSGEKNMVVYPNPAKDQLNLLLPVTNNKTWTIVVVNATGSVVMNKTISGNMFATNINSFNTGVYYIKAINNEAGTLTGRLVKQ